MKVISSNVLIEDKINSEEILKKLEKYGRTCYKSEDRITKDSSHEFIKKIIELGHESVLEHEKITVRIICDRGVSHQIVRHRIGSYSQESTRFCNYCDDKFGSELTFIKPNYFSDDKLEIWEKAMQKAEESYFLLRNLGATAQEARAVLPNSIKTEIVVTYNLREWRHFLKVRTSTKAHPQMQEIANQILLMFQEMLSIVFDDLEVKK